MATFVLMHGAGSTPWYWHLVEPELRDRGHDVVVVDLPCDDDSAGFPEYADATVAAIADRRDLILVAQSLAGFTAPLVCERVPVDLMVLLAAMVPRPGESAGEWWANTGQEQAMREQAELEGRDPNDQTPETIFLHDLPQELLADSLQGVRTQSATPFAAPWPLAAWPDVPTKFLLCREDRLFPAELQQRVVRERLGIVPDEMDGGHLPALSRPKDLARRLDEYGQQSSVSRAAS